MPAWRNPGRAARTDDLNAKALEFAGEVDDASLVRDADECAPDFS